MLKYAVRLNGVDWRRIDIVDAGAPEEMELAFRRGAADYVHLQAPASDQLEQDGLGRIVVSVGKSMPPVAFSSLCCSRDFLHTERCRSFLEAFRQARKWVRSARAEEVAQKERDLFPGISAEALTAAIRRYQTMGCWDGEPEIPRDLYEQALTVFESEGEINRRHAYEQVCGVAATP
jgi:ABC-type nitrate/sulfonate/bicarbonate transport system substrate-binding protein